jgi:hypothetical protein
MSEQAMDEAPRQQRPYTKIVNRTSASVPVYGFGFIGALVYYIQHATTFAMGLLGILKAIVWPAMLVYQALETLKM